MSKEKKKKRAIDKETRPLIVFRSLNLQMKIRREVAKLIGLVWTGTRMMKRSMGLTINILHTQNMEFDIFHMMKELEET